MKRPPGRHGKESFITVRTGFPNHDYENVLKYGYIIKPNNDVGEAEEQLHVKATPLVSELKQPVNIQLDTFQCVMRLCNVIHYKTAFNA